MKNKKKIIALFLAAVSILMLSACNNELPPDDSQTVSREPITHMKFSEDVSLSSYSNRDILSDSEDFPDVLSARYIISGWQLFHIKHGVIVMSVDTTADKFHTAVESSDVVLYNQQDDVLSGNDVITTGGYVQYKGADRYKIVILGDLNGDGIIDDTDIKEMEKYVGNTPENAESDLKFLAADVNDSGNVTQYDIDTVTEMQEYKSDIIKTDEPIDKNDPGVLYDYLHVTVKKEDYIKQHESPKFYGSEVKSVESHLFESPFGGEYYSIHLFLDKKYSIEDFRSLRSRIELLDGVYNVEYSRSDGLLPADS